MWIYVLRHGIAHDREAPDCPPDPQRALTDKGVTRTRAAVEGMAALGIEADLVLTSPYVRARQTADIARNQVARAADLVELSSLEPGGDPAEVCRTIVERNASAALCVGHAPDLDELIAHLIDAGGPVTHLKKAGLACIEAERADRGAGQLFALYPPRALRRLARLQANSQL